MKTSATSRTLAPNQSVTMMERPACMETVSGPMFAPVKWDGKSQWNNDFARMSNIFISLTALRDGHLCDQCVPLPGCEHGSCEFAFECNCETDASGNNTLWEGAFCDRRKQSISIHRSYI